MAFQVEVDNGSTSSEALRTVRVLEKGLEQKHHSKCVAEWADSGVVKVTNDPKFLVPLNPVPQAKVDHPVRITGDFESFNRYIVSDSTETSNEVCSEAIMRLRRHEQWLFMDLSKAYQSVILAEELRDYNAFKINDV